METAMTAWKRAILLGLLVWLLPFVVAFAALAIKQSWRSLFESIMPLTLAIVVVGCGNAYLRRVPQCSVAEAARLGLLWLAISVAIDLPLMLSPPISYTPSEYAADIGLTYVMMPVITIGLAVAAHGSRNAK
jgi:hypothetical protein